MDLITQFPLGDDLAVALLVLAALSIAALVLGAVVPARLRGAEEADEIDGELGRRLGQQLSAAGWLLLWVGVPALGLLWLIPGTTDDRLLRSAMLLAGLLLGPLAAWRGLALQLAALVLPEERRTGLITRLGALSVAGALALAVLPVTLILWFLQEGGSSALMSLAAGAALSALAIRVTLAPTEAAAAASALLVGVDENDQTADDAENLGGPLLRTAGMLRRGAGLSADLVALTTAGAALGVMLGVPVLAAEGILVVLLALGTALLATGAVALLPLRADEIGQEADAIRLRGLIPAGLVLVGLVVAAALWLPSAYQDLRFAHVGMDMFTDPAIAGSEPVARDSLEEQILPAVEDMSQWVSATDDGRDAGAFLDVLTLYTISPSAVTAAALGLGAIVALAAVLLLGGNAQRSGGTVLRAARTSRTGGALGLAAGLGSTALAAAGVLAAAVIVAGVISVLSGGVPGLALALLAQSGLAALAVLACFSASLFAPALGDRPESPRTLREAAGAAPVGPHGALLVAAAMIGVTAVGPVVTALQVAARGATVWEDRALHALTPLSLTLLGGVGVGVIGVLLVTASLLDAARRLGADAVVITRAAILEDRDRADLPDLAETLRRATLTPVVVLVLLPVVAAFGLGPAALPGVVVGGVLTAAALGLWSLGAAGTLEGAESVIARGRYGGRASWGHSGALTGTVLTGILRAVLGSVAAPALLVTSAVSALLVSGVVALSTDGTDPYLRLGIAVIALLIMLVCWVVSATAAEVDLEDGQEQVARPLFARPAEETEAPLEAMDWEDEDAEIEQVAVPVRTAPKKLKRRQRRAQEAAERKKAEAEEDSEEDSGTTDED
ncbi:pyrophosphatase [Brachybacterium sp. J144]|uniref:pyrophosphatase n=1 Tax=Brachybacterium sp. J144 TaxID=3116487 RepID=UPI002E7923E9|nr:pyrophosphatase [Brachybacterium sp. J144]MEE1650944.1 pyrophosphatase [Brachybacterium sp. J144]